MGTTARVRAPELRGRGWLNTGGRDLKLADLRGKIVLLDFWTFCCINCLHVLDELRPLEEKYGDVLVVIGVHSPKFEHEKDADALAAAVERYGVHHPVLDDPELDMWQQYAARAWPTLSVIDPEGYVVATMAGEGHAEGLARLIDELIATHEAKGTLHRGDGPYVPPPAPETALRFPGKAVLLPNGNLLVSDSARHSPGRVGPGRRDAGAAGSARASGAGPTGRPARRRSPSRRGCCLLPDARRRGRRLRPGGRRHRQPPAARRTAGDRRGGHRGRHRAAVARHGRRPRPRRARRRPLLPVGPGLVRRQAHHRDGRHPPALVVRPDQADRRHVRRHHRRGAARRPAGRGVDGAAVGPVRLRRRHAGSGSPTARPAPSGTSRTACWAPPSGRACSTSGTWTARPTQALLQHPLGVCALPDGSVLIADTYNGAVRRFDPATGQVVHGRRRAGRAERPGAHRRR